MGTVARNRAVPYAFAENFNNHPPSSICRVNAFRAFKSTE